MDILQEIRNIQAREEALTKVVSGEIKPPKGITKESMLAELTKEKERVSEMIDNSKEPKEEEKPKK